MNKIAKNPFSLPVIIFLFFIAFHNSGCVSYKQSKNNSISEQNDRLRIVDEAKTYIGVGYKYAGKNPGGFDCSGFTSFVFSQHRIPLRASSKLQAKQGSFKDLDDVEAGDLVFFGPPLKIDHVGIVTAKKKGKLFVIHSTSSQGVVEHDIYQISYWKKRLKFARDVISP